MKKAILDSGDTMLEKVDPETLLTNLSQFTGTENYYRHWTGLIVFTDGVKYLADKAGAYWLIDLVASWQVRQEVKKCPFQIWELKVSDDKTAIATMREDSDQPEVVRQEIPYTDFPLEKIKLYLVEGVLMLPSEY